MKRLVFVLLLVLFAVPLASAIGVSPGRITIDFEPGETGSVNAIVWNTNDFPVDVTAGPEGRYHDAFSVDEFSLGPRERKQVTIRYVLPDEIDPGTNRQKIVFVENFFDPSGGFGARTGVALQVDLWKPYPGRYVDLAMTPRNVPQGSDTDVLVKLYSRGDQAVSGDVELRFYTPEDKLQDLVMLQDVNVDGNSNFEKYALVQSNNWEPGKYRVEASYDYGAGVAREESRLIIGTQSVDIVDVTRTYYKDTDVNRFEVQAESLWNEPLGQVFATFELGASSGQTPSITLAPFTRGTLFGYWETDVSLPQGNHTALVTVDFAGGEPVTESFVVEVLNVTPIREEVPASTADAFSVEVGLIDLLFFLIVIALVVYIMHHGVHQHRKKR